MVGLVTKSEQLQVVHRWRLGAYTARLTQRDVAIPLFDAEFLVFGIRNKLL